MVFEFRLGRSERDLAERFVTAMQRAAGALEKLATPPPETDPDPALAAAADVAERTAGKLEATTTPQS